MPKPVNTTKATALDVRAALKEAIARLRAAHVASHTLAAELLLMHALACDRTWLYTNPETPIDPGVVREYFALVARRASGEPTQYLTGKQEFWGLDFEVTPAVLIPRPETEHVIEVALERLGPRGIKIDMATGAPNPELRVADVGTGSGCLAVAFAHELPHAEITATDISAAALDVARRNAVRHSVLDRIHFVHTNLLDACIDDALLTHYPPAIPDQKSGITRHRWQPFDLIVSNPPYVARTEAGTLAREVRDHEPHAALFGGPAGTEIYSRLIEQAGELLRAGGILVLELGHNSADEVRKMLDVQPRWANVSITSDLAGIPRVLAAIRI
jgi:release factor glutamine methyltransferase